MKRIIPAVLIFILIGFSNYCFSQTGNAQSALQGTGNMNFGYCLSNIDLTPAQQAKIDKLMTAQQEKMAVLRTRVRTATTWEEKAAYWDQMDAMVVKHREEIWAVVPEGRAQANIGRLNRPYYGRANAASVNAGTVNTGALNTGALNTGAVNTGTAIQGTGYYGRVGYGRVGYGGVGYGGVGYRGVGYGKGRGGVGWGAGRGLGRGLGRGVGRGYIR